MTVEQLMELPKEALKLLHKRLSDIVYDDRFDEINFCKARGLAVWYRKETGYRICPEVGNWMVLKGDLPSWDSVTNTWYTWKCNMPAPIRKEWDALKDRQDKYHTMMCRVITAMQRRHYVKTIADLIGDEEYNRRTLPLSQKD